MNLREIKAKRDKATEKIFEILKELGDETECEINDIELVWEDGFGLKPETLVSVILELRIP